MFYTIAHFIISFIGTISTWADKCFVEIITPADPQSIFTFEIEHFDPAVTFCGWVFQIPVFCSTSCSKYARVWLMDYMQILRESKKNIKISWIIFLHAFRHLVFDPIYIYIWFYCNLRRFVKINTDLKISQLQIKSLHVFFTLGKLLFREPSYFLVECPIKLVATYFFHWRIYKKTNVSNAEINEDRGRAR